MPEQTTHGVTDNTDSEVYLNGLRVVYCWLGQKYHKDTACAAKMDINERG